MPTPATPSRWPPRVVEALAWAGFFLCVRWVFGLFEYGVLEPSPLFNSDGLYLADLWRDVRAGGRLADWNLPHATFVLPDLVVWVLLDSVAPSVQWAVLLFGVVQVTAAAALTRWWVAREGGPWAAPLGPAVWAAVCLVISQHRATEALDAFKPVHHFSVGLVGLSAVALLARALRGGTRWWVGLLVLTFLVTFSDPFGVSTVWAPLVGLLALVVLRDPVARRARAGWAVALGLAGYAGHAVAARVTHVEGDLGSFKWEALGDQWARWCAALDTLTPDAIDALAVIGVLSFVPLFVRGLRRLKAADGSALLDLLPLTAAVINQGLLFATGNVVHVIFNRYLIVIFVYLVVTLARLMALAMRGPVARQLLGGGAACFALVAGALMSSVGAQPRLFPFTGYQPPAVWCLQALSARVPLQRGLAEFWTARTTSLLNPLGLKLETLTSDGQPRVWLNDVAAFRKPSPPFNFVVLEHLDPQFIAARFGPPTVQAVCGELTIWWYDPAASSRLTAAVLSMAPAAP